MIPVAECLAAVSRLLLSQAGACGGVVLRRGVGSGVFLLRRGLWFTSAVLCDLDTRSGLALLAF